MVASAQQLQSLVLAQIAAESYLDGVIGGSPEILARRLRLGSNSFVFAGDNDAASRDPSLTGYTRMTDAQITQFVSRYDVVDHLPNTITGFSATLLRDRLDNRYVLSIRSTEFPNEDRGGDWLRDGLAGADGEIGDFGFAYAQIADMEAYYQRIVKPLITDATTGTVGNFLVTGFSLGGHLATVFAEAHQFDPGFLQAYTFNGPGRGAFAGDMAALVNQAYQALSASGVDALLRSGAGGENIYAEGNFYTAANGIRAALHTFAGLPAGVNVTVEGSAQNLAGGKIVQVYGQGDTDDTTWVANAGVHSSNKVRLFIEDQPDVQGLGPITVLDPLINVRSDFGTTHSITLIADTLAVMTLLQKLAPSISADAMKSIFSAGSNERGIGFIGQQGLAESNSLEKIVESLSGIFAIDIATVVQMAGGDRGDGLLQIDDRGGGFGNWLNRNIFYKVLEAINAQVMPASNFTIEVLAGQVVTDIVTAATNNTARGLAYRYALKESNPFALIDAAGVGIYARFQAGGANAGELDLYSPASSGSALTETWIQDRANFLARLGYYNNLNARYDLTRNSENPKALGDSTATQYDTEKIVWDDRVSNVLIQREAETDQTAYRRFGGNLSESLGGGKVADRLYAGGGADLLIGGGGDDYLEGGTGIDLYEYDSARKGLLLSTPDGHDTILDVDGKGVLRYLERDAGGQVQSTAIAGIALREPDGTWKTPDGRFTFERTGTSDLKVSFGAAIEGSVTVRDFDFTKAEQSGFMGLRLAATRVVPQTTGNIIQGDLEPLDNDPATPDIQTTTNELGNIVVTTNAAPDREDTLFGGRPDVAMPPDTAGNSIQAGGGNDIILSDRPNGQADNGLGNADLIDAGAGRDAIEAGTGNDRVIGGTDGVLTAGAVTLAGGDLIDGGAGDDVLFGNVVATLTEAITVGNTATAINAQGDFISGGTGDDWITGDAAHDALLGGEGRDVISGGGGNDNILGDDARRAAGFDWTATRNVIANPSGGNTYELLFNGLTGDAGISGDADVIYGGAGDDWVFAGRGDDFVEGGSGANIIFGNGGADILIGGAVEALDLPFSEIRAG